MICYAEARARLDALARDFMSRSVEHVALRDARGRVLAEAVTPSFDIPSFDNSAMDGFAVRAADGAASRRVAGRAVAGDAPAAGGGDAWEIATGAPLPLGFDAVVKVEDVAREGDAIHLRRAPTLGENVRRRGGDFTAGTGAVAAGTRLEPRHAMALAALGVSVVPARRRPRLHLLSTGAELVAPPELPTPPPPGLIYDASGPYLAHAAEAFGAAVVAQERLSDDPAAFLARLEEVRERKPELLITTGAVSVGPHDFIADTLARAGAELLFHRVAIRPGKPVLVARLGETVVFSLPGNPVSTAVGWRFFVTPFLRAFLGMAPETPRLVRLSRPIVKPEGLRCFWKSRLGPDGASPLAAQGSHEIRGLLDSSGWLVLPEARREVAEGALVELFSPEDAGG